LNAVKDVIIKMNIYVLAIVAYVLLLIIAGFAYSRKVKNAADFFVAGRKLGPSLLFVTMIASNIGAGSTLGVAGLAYRNGLSAWWWIAASAVGSLILAFVIGPMIWRVAKTHNLLTLGDYLEHRYHRNFRGFISLLMAVGSLAIFAGQLMGIAWILNVVAGTNKLTGILLGATAVVLYFGTGGLMSVARVNIIEVIVKIAGFSLAVWFALSYVGGWNGLTATITPNLSASPASSTYLTWTGSNLSLILGYFLMLTPSFFISPALIGKVYGANNVRTVRIGTALNALVQFIFAIVPVLLGICAFAIFPSLPSSDMALPIVTKELMPTGFAALALAAIFSAEISAADAVLYIITTAFVNDLYKNFCRPNLSDVGMLKISRVTTVVAGLIGVVIALHLPNIIAALSIFYALMSVSLTAPLLFGLFSRHPSTKAAFASSLCGMVMMIYLHFWQDGKGFWILNDQSVGTLASIIVMLAMMYIYPKKN